VINLVPNENKTDEQDKADRLSKIQEELVKLSETLEDRLEKTKTEVKEETKQEILDKIAKDKETEKAEAKSEKNEEENKAVDIEAIQKQAYEKAKQEIAEQQERESTIKTILDSYSLDGEKRTEIEGLLKNRSITDLKLALQDAQLREQARKTTALPPPDTSDGKEALYGTRVQRELVVKEPEKLSEQQKNLIYARYLERTFPGVKLDPLYNPKDVPPVDPKTIEWLQHIRRRTSGT